MASNRLQRGLKATFLGLAINMVLAAGKMAAGIIGHSHALVADGVESLADIFSSIVVWRGLVVAAAPADAEHPYGHGKAEPLAAAIVSATLLLAAVVISIQAGAEVLHPQTRPAAYTLYILLGVIIIKEGLFRYVLGVAKSSESTAVRTDAWHHRSDAITSLAAAIGISIALIGGQGYERADDIAAIVAALIIAWNGFRLLRPAVNELMDSAPDARLVNQIKRVAEEIPEVGRVEKCVVRKMGYHYFVDMHIEVAPEMTVRRAHEVAHSVKDRVRERIPSVRDVLVHIEPQREL